MAILEAALRDDLNGRAERRVAVLDPIRLVIEDWPADKVEACHAPNHPQKPELGYIVKCERIEKDASGKVTTIYCSHDPATKSGLEGGRNVKGNIHWISTRDAIDGEVRLYDRLFSVATPGSGDTDYLTQINPKSVDVLKVKLEPELANAKPEERFQFERHGYFVADMKDCAAGRPVFNRAVTLRDSWGKDAR